MNRLVIIGNGFDIAHGLPTRYSDFINSYWGKISSSDFKDEMVSFSKSGYNFTKHKTLSEKITYLQSHEDFQANAYEHEVKCNFVYYIARPKKESFIKYNNSFFLLLNQRYSDCNWVDIENLYYQELKRRLNNPHDDENYQHQEILKLNSEFECIRNEFYNYLKTEVNSLVKTKYNQKLVQILRSKQFKHKSSFEDFLQEFPAITAKEIRKEINKKPSESDILFEINQTYILNFNYTFTVENYHPNVDVNKIIYIHGHLGGEINFGFGDEMDESYKIIEDKNKNDYLKFMKSFAYSNSPRYKALFDFVESDDFQIHIMGHSCGISDRTLLNAIFEHQRCKSIKVFYHRYKNSNNDNYIDIVQNISRHFNKKKLMRERVVNKEFCEPLPQLT